MIYFIFGEEEFLKKEKLKELKKKFKSFFVKKIEDEKNFKEEIESSSLFGKKFLVLYDFLSLKKSTQKEIKEILEKKDLLEKKEIVLVFFQQKEIRKQSPLYEFLKKKKGVKKFYFKKLSFFETEKFVLNEIKKLNGKIQKEAASLLAFLGHGDLYFLKNEIEKLVLFKKGKTITKKDVFYYTPDFYQTDIFLFLEEYFKKGKKPYLLWQILKRKENPGKFFSIIVWQFRNLIKIKSLYDKKTPLKEIAEKLKLHPFLVKKFLFLSQNFSEKNLNQIYLFLLNLDLKIKRGELDPFLALKKFLLSLTNL